MTFVPHGSSIRINCTAARGQIPSWSIQFSETSDSANFLQFTRALESTLNSRGFYENPQPEDDSITHLLINTTQDNNGTMIKCTGGGSLNPTIFETTLIVYGT